MKLLILIFIILNSLSVQAGNDVGGGVGFCITEKKCITLAEAGFRIAEDNLDQPAISPDVFEEAQNVIDSLPMHRIYQDMLKNITDGEIGTFKRVEVINKVALDKIKREYFNILRAQRVSSEGLIIYALSDRNATYILPEFEKLNTRSKALILIHEGIVRHTGSVPTALYIDGAIDDTLHGKPNTMGIVKVLMKFFPKTVDLKAKDLRIRNANYVFAAYAREYTYKTKSYIRFQDIFSTRSLPSMESYPNGFKTCLVSSQDSTLNARHYKLWSFLSSEGLKCFDFIPMPNLSVNVCSNQDNGKYILENSLSEDENAISFSNLVIECKDKNIVSSYLIQLGRAD